MKKGITLIELLVTIVIIAILGMMAFSGYVSFRDTKTTTIYVENKFVSNDIEYPDFRVEVTENGNKTIYDATREVFNSLVPGVTYEVRISGLGDINKIISTKSAEKEL